MTKLLADPVQVINRNLYRYGPSRFSSVDLLMTDIIAEVSNGSFEFHGLPTKFLEKKDNNISKCMYLTRSKKKSQESEKSVIIGKNREKTSLQPLPNSKRETVRNKLTCWLNDLHLKLCKERLVYQFNPA